MLIFPRFKKLGHILFRDISNCGIRAPAAMGFFSLSGLWEKSLRGAALPNVRPLLMSNEYVFTGAAGLAVVYKLLLEDIKDLFLFLFCYFQGYVVGSVPPAALVKRSSFLLLKLIMTRPSFYIDNVWKLWYTVCECQWSRSNWGQTQCTFETRWVSVGPGEMHVKCRHRIR